MMGILELETFVTPFYLEQDTMHDLSHVMRIFKAAKMLAKRYGDKVNSDLIVFGCYLHGVIVEHESEISQFLVSKGLPPEKVHKIAKVSWESLKERVPETLEGKIVHDAHLIEGGRTFLIVKSLITGSMRGQTLEETISYVEKEVLGRFSCHLPEAQRILAEKEKFARSFLGQLKKDLAPSRISKKRLKGGPPQTSPAIFLSYHQ